MTDGDTPDVTPLYEEWSLHGAGRYATDDLRALSRYLGLEHDDLRACLTNAAGVVDVPDEDGRGQVVPLHAADGPEPTDEYVVWDADSDAVGYFDESFGISGADSRAPLDDVVATEIAHRVRFWHPDHAPDAGDDGDALADVDVPSAVAAEAPLAGEQRRAFFDDLRETVRGERAAEREGTREAHADADLGQLIGERAVDGPFVLVGTTAHSDRPADVRVQYAPEDGVPADIDLVSAFDLYPDNHVLLDAFEDALPLPARVASVDGPVVTLRPAWERTDDPERAAAALEDADPFWLRGLLNPVPYARRLDALDAVWETPEKRRLLTGERDLSVSRPPSRRRADLALDDHQSRALALAVAADDVLCIHGPPGTGKTRTLAAVVAESVARGERVLVTAHSNQAVDNLLVGDSTPDDPDEASLHGVLGDDQSVDVARYGRHSRNRVVDEHYRQRGVATADVVAATTNGAATFDQDAFDVAVVDEATQASRAATAIAVNAAEKLVLAGDHRQLPPYGVREGGAGEMRPSLFETILDRYGDDVAVLLARQYRMHDAIAAFPNEAFYGGRLETADEAADRTVDGLPAVELFDVAGAERREERGASVRNAAEAGVAAERAAAILDAGVDPGDVGVIAAYSGQVSEIRRALADRGLDRSALTVDTVDSFQGGEREAVVVSFARSNDAHDAGFLEHPEEGPRRLNVALTRARRHLSLVGDWETLTKPAGHRDSEDSCAGVYAALYDALADLDAARLTSR
ncbi:AAA domain-containing protein [Halobacterium jilantaiense]|uniref:Superfamily I DNA and/or RNA helicase n=1 Tax=Halobacterium jilantaiense TaxID=355548 RepID=A0A1I0PYH4_9EURY|nr:DEAD/DEAH box helicase [Halobacterium jilantaiense]SEW19688.1 Superfamily I DNA and/or RNA helicase [Halobacterium jilantaiense]